MDIDHLHRLVTAVFDEAEHTNADGPAQSALEAYLFEIVSVRKPIVAAVRKEAFVQGFLRAHARSCGLALSDFTDEQLLSMLPEADKAFIAYRKERER